MAGARKNVRLVTLQFDQVFEVDNDGKIDGKCSFKGMIGDTITMLMEPTKKYSNCTIDVAQGALGSYNSTTRTYSGALGLIQQGLADAFPLPLYYPLHDPNNEYFDYSNPIREDEMMIVCGYNSTVFSSVNDIMEMFTSVDTDLWWATLIGFLTFVFLLKTGYKILGIGKKYKSPLWMVTCAFLFEDNFPEDIPFNKIITVSACLFLFFFGGYLLNSMSSDLIVYDSPKVIASYADALKRVADGSKLEIIFYGALPEAEKFRESDPDSIEGKLWKLAMPLEQNVQNNGIAWFSKLVGPIVNQTVIGIMRNYLVESVTAWALTKVDENGILPEMRALLSIDSSSKKYTNVMVFGKKIDPVAREQIVLATQRLTESGIHEFEFSHLYEKFAFGRGFMTLTKKSSTKLETPEAELPVTRLENTKVFFTVMAGMVLFSLAVFVAEMVGMKLQLWTRTREHLSSIMTFGRSIKNRIAASISGIFKEAEPEPGSGKNSTAMETQ